MKVQHIQPKNQRQDDLLRAVEGPSQLVVTTGPAGVGKAQPVDEPVLTPDGWVPIGQLRVGDKVLGRDGGEQSVEGVYPQGRRRVYRVSTHDGRSTRADGEHLWLVERAGWPEARVVTTAELADGLDPARPYGIQPWDGWRDESTTLAPVDPYLLGWVLGSKSWDYGGREWPRRVPEEYIRRWPTATLTGLLDGGATIRANGAVEFSRNVSVTPDVVELVRRCGGIVDPDSDSKFMTLRFQDPRRFFRSFKALQRLSERAYRQRIRITEVFPDGVEECVCIRVSNPDRLYVTRDYIVTHNTYCAVNAAVNEYYRGHYSTVVLSRPNQPTGRSLGYFPGTVEEKLEPWLQPLLSQFKARMEKGEYEVARKKWITIQPLEVIRGTSFVNSLILVDEAQNLNWEELKAVSTRIGEGSKMILMGDPMQRDTKHDDLGKFIRLLSSVEAAETVNFTVDDIVRSSITMELVKLFMREQERAQEGPRLAS